MSDETTPDEAPEGGAATIYVRPAVAGRMHNLTKPITGKERDVTERTVRKWIATGQLHGVQIAGTWMVPVTREQLDEAGISYDETVTADDEPPPPGVVSGGSPSTSSTPPTAPALPPPPPVDLEPLAEIIRDLTRENAQLAATAAMHQERSRFLEARNAELEGRVLALEAGPEPDPDPAPDQAPQPARRSWWRRLFVPEPA